MGDVASVRNALLELHRQLLEAQRIQAERSSGRMTASELLQAATDDLRFSWLKELSELLAALDQARADADAAASEAALHRARALLAPPDADSAFGARYLRALQDHPEVVMAHRDVTTALAAER
jgi:gluconate kinase